ncbi:MAG: prephenate dehydrogenase [Chloroflexota bacterium]
MSNVLPKSQQKKLKDCSVTIVGLGLMGASLCMDLSQNHLCREVRGVARRTETVMQAFFAEAVNLATDDLETGIQGADIVIFCTPVKTIISMLEDIGSKLWPGTIVMDMGSTKAEICEALDTLPEHVQPIGAHPMAGKETAGFTSAETGLYHNATWVLSPLERTSPETVNLATELVEAVGANPVVLEPARHDRLVASISHLPYLAASAFVDCVTGVGNDDPMVWELAAGGFRDTSRVAASDTRMFVDILQTNRLVVLEQLACFIDHLQEMQGLLAESEFETLRKKLDGSKIVRSNWTKYS